MTAEEQARIDYLKRSGAGYKKIAQVTGLSESTIKSYFLRRKGGPLDDLCPFCGKKVEQVPHRKQKRFCSEVCRLSWWKANKAIMNTPGEHTVHCRTCGKEFRSYRSTAGYCSRECYYASRRKGAAK